ncbi:MAG: dipeptide epimerase [Lewinellaceae bacterium]|nr:dipeptide epimerase [Lewinellaceae bacterium]
MLQLSYRPLLLELRHPFRIATGMRTHTNAVLTEISMEGLTGFGEAAMPPYYGENHDTAAAFLEKAASLLAGFRFRRIDAAFIAETMATIDALAPGNNAAKASIDIALHDLWGKTENKPLWKLLEVSQKNMPPTSFTLGIDTPEVLREKMAEAADFSMLKIKLGSDDDRQIIRTVRELSNKPIFADANQGWKNREAALDLVYWLQEQDVVLVEQPFHKDDLESAAWLSERSPLPVIADESFQRLSDLNRIAGCFQGVNIKLMKCTGLSEGIRAAHAARGYGLQLMVGCMTETSCGISAAAALAPLCDYADIDGCWLIGNNPFAAPMLENGRILLSGCAGVGAV